LKRDILKCDLTKAEEGFTSQFMPRIARLDARLPAPEPRDPPAIAWRCIQPKRRHAWQWRAGGGQAPGVLHHIMIRGIERRKIFRDNRDRDNLLYRLAKLLPEIQTACYAWVFIANHALFLFRIPPWRDAAKNVLDKAKRDLANSPLMGDPLSFPI